MTEAKHTADEILELNRLSMELLLALKDMASGWRYIRQTHGDLPGVGWDRAQSKAEDAIAHAEAWIDRKRLAEERAEMRELLRLAAEVIDDSLEERAPRHSLGSLYGLIQFALKETKR